jgi:hypothetical protein
MRKSRKQAEKTIPRQENLVKSVHAKIEQWKRMLNGDEDALWECMYDRGMCSKEDLDEHYKNKGQSGD